jgi:hypothetical protein
MHLLTTTSTLIVLYWLDQIQPDRGSSVACAIKDY